MWVLALRGGGMIGWRVKKRKGREGKRGEVDRPIFICQSGQAASYASLGLHVIHQY